MTKPSNRVEVIPSARRLIHSLRDVGYDLPHAVADLVDNSLAAGSSRVSIEMRFEGEKSWLRVADNGRGMSGQVITEAMRFGTEREYEADELGKFGLGLKTASLSQCSRLTVASRTDPKSHRIEVRQWDLAHVEATNRWEILILPKREWSDSLVGPLEDTTGTVVLWELLDRILGYKVPWGDHARNGFFRLAADLDLHLGMVFHKFLTGEARRRKRLSITINDTLVEAWDPFARSEKGTIKLPGREFEVAIDGASGSVSYVPYILPPQEAFSSLKSFNRSAGPSKWNYQQGFYIYRADRMVQSGGWCRMRTPDEHTKLARAALDFWPDLDSAFDLNVAKARVNLPAELRDQLKRPVELLAKEARQAYTPRAPRSGGGVKAASDGTASGGPSPGGESRSNRRRSLARALEQAAARAGELKALGRIRNALKSENPGAADEIGW